MAKIRLSNGIVSGTPTEQNDTVTVGTDTPFQYSLALLGGNDKVALGPAIGLARYQIFTGKGNDTVTGGSGFFRDSQGKDTYKIAGQAVFVAGSGNDIYSGGESGEARKLYTILDRISFQFAPDQEELTQLVFKDDLIIDLRKTTPQALGAFGADTLIGIENVTTGDGNDRIIGDSDFNSLTGSGGNDKIYGNAGGDALFGDGGDDLLYGGSGRDSLYDGVSDGVDKLYGGSGSDLLSVSNGKDIVTGGTGGDVFVLKEGIASKDVVAYSSINDSKLFSQKVAFDPTFTFQLRDFDIIDSFDAGGLATDDIIRFETIDTSKKAGDQDFEFIGSRKFAAGASWQIRLKVVKEFPQSTLNSTLIQVDTDSDSKAEFEILVRNVTGLSAHDFDL